MKRLNTSKGISGITSLLMGITTLLFCYSVSAEEYNDWSGQYAGMSLGVMAGKVNPSTTVTKGISYYSQDEDVTKLNSIFSSNFSDNDFSGTLIYGYQWQSERLVYGIEANLIINDYSSSKAVNEEPYASASSLYFNSAIKIKNTFGLSIRPKVGYTFDNVLIDFSAGPTLSKFKYEFSLSDSTNQGTTGDYSDSKWALGVSAGLDFNYKMDNDYALYASYLYSYYPDIVDGSNHLKTSSSTFAEEFKHDASFSSHTVSVGLVKYF